MKKAILSFSIILLFASCGELVKGLNENPNSPTTASYQYILTGAEVGNIVLQTGEVARKAGIFCGYYTGIDRQHLGFSQYGVTTSDFDSEWNNVYVDVVANALAAEMAAEEEGVGGVTKGITQALRAMALGTAASLWGDIPFDEAGQPEIEGPAFEGQLSAYSKLQNLLDEAIANLASGSGRPASGSEIYLDGSPVAWTEVAYSLKARYYMHTREYEKAYAAAQNGISSPDNSLMAPHGAAAENSNLNYSFFAVEVRQSDLLTSDFMASLIAPDASASPDFSKYRGNAKTNETGRYNFLFRMTSFGIQPNTSSNAFAAQTAPAPLVTFEENSLILAEAGFRTAGIDKGLEHLNDYRAYLAAGGYMANASPASLQYDPYEAADFESGGMENADGLSAGNALLREILEERYVSFFGQIEGFNDTRRTESETLTRVPVAPNVGSNLPQRFLYPTTEIDRNPNVPKPVPGFFDPTPVNK
ncbi:MAG: SusD/RagB family nutrient-binding outer membrane lipoprotein [Phaeodactylibacter sp.]|nr:SusD/RagB family nutrient-binding outer membrane lipoprotein [Phaeodactylibacter sp.]MCB9050190.1 SusD/RagB family nutrient-binding outer membrane lipoprotein [Lewinellaceae bacterium]